MLRARAPEKQRPAYVNSCSVTHIAKRAVGRRPPNNVQWRAGDDLGIIAAWVGGPRCPGWRHLARRLVDVLNGVPCLRIQALLHVAPASAAARGSLAPVLPNPVHRYKVTMCPLLKKNVLRYRTGEKTRMFSNLANGRVFSTKIENTAKLKAASAMGQSSLQHHLIFDVDIRNCAGSLACCLGVSVTTSSPPSSSALAARPLPRIRRRLVGFSSNSSSYRVWTRPCNIVQSIDTVMPQQAWYS
jgi:hypothetical protein